MVDKESVCVILVEFDRGWSMLKQWMDVSSRKQKCI